MLVSAYEVDPAAGGEAGFGWHTGRLLAERGLEVHVVTHERSRVAIGRVGALPAGLNFHFVSPGQPMVGLRSGQRGVYANYLLWQRACLERARELHDQRTIDVIHHVSWASLFWGSPLWRVGVPFVFGPGGGAQTSPKILAPQFGTAWRRERLRNSALRFGLWLNPLARRTITHAAAFLATNRETFAAVTRFGARHTELLLDVALPASSILETEREFPGTDAPIV
ncbi:MAG: glycosyltransferase, partial [Actinomycetes bacterium]